MKKRILIIRFSAMGDVAMVASILKEFQQQHKNIEQIVVSRSLFASFFKDIPNTVFHPFFPSKQHKGLKGIWKLFQELKRYNIDYVADLHHNIRSIVLDTMFKSIKTPVVSLNKGRSEKKLLTRSKHKIKTPLKTTIERYADVFRELGFNIELKNKLQKLTRPIPNSIQQLFKSNKKKIGIAPFAQHAPKVWKTDNWIKVFQSLSSGGYHFIIFGGGAQEEKTANIWESQFPHVLSTIGKFKLTEELDIISHLDMMISMDSAGMHMASLVGTRCLSLWGATHPYAGFLGYGQSLDDCIQVEHPNRPSSVYGNKSCICDGIEAIDLITIDEVVNRIKHSF